MDLPFITGTPQQSAKVRSPIEWAYAPLSNLDLAQVEASFGLALHMHQPTILARGDLRSSALVSNLQHMMEHQHEGDNHNAPVFLQCYGRVLPLVEDLVTRGRNPRLMLDYSGNLLWGLQQMGADWVIDNLRRLACEPTLQRHVEFLGTMWSHAVASSTPVPDLELQMMAWRFHFAALFGVDAVRRVKGFSAPEMHLPIHPDLCFEYLRALKACGYWWLMVQEDTVETLEGGPITRPHWPHRLLARNSLGQTHEITVLIKTKGSDTKLVGQMQPYAEARSTRRLDHCGLVTPPFVLQIGDGENGGVMMNEFPNAFERAFDEIGTIGVVACNGSEYLELLRQAGADETRFPAVQPVGQHKIWRLVTTTSPGACEAAVATLRAEGFNLDRASWTNSRSWVTGYDEVLDPMNRLSAAFHQKLDGASADPNDARTRQALLYLLLSQTSCFRYWGAGHWTDCAQELCRRGLDLLG